MKRDVRLQGLSSDHHHALALARRVRLEVEAGRADAALAEATSRSHHESLEPHFAVEEEVLLPALDAAGRRDLVRRTLADHGELRLLVEHACAGSPAALGRFAALLESHVRFEEHELFPACEELLAPSVLDAVAARAPKPDRDG